MDYCGTIGSVNITDMASEERRRSLYQSAPQYGNFAMGVPAPVAPSYYPLPVAPMYYPPQTYSMKASPSYVPTRSASYTFCPTIDLPATMATRRASASAGVPVPAYHQQMNIANSSPMASMANHSVDMDTRPRQRQVSFQLDTTTSDDISSPPISPPLRPILKRQKSGESVASGTTSNSESPPPMAGDDSELQTLLHSLNRFGLANESYSEPTIVSIRPEDATVAQVESKQVKFTVDADDQPSKGRGKKRRKKTKKSKVKSEDEMDEDEMVKMSSAIARARPSISMAAMRKLIRGGGASRAMKRETKQEHKNNMGTISSRMKTREKFQRPTIITDAYNRVSTMKLGTNPLPCCVKHIAFPFVEGQQYDNGADTSMPYPRGYLRHDSVIDLETLDMIGTRAASPVHLLKESAPTYKHVRSRVDSYNLSAKPKQELRRPSAWLLS